MTVLLKNGLVVASPITDKEAVRPGRMAMTAKVVSSVTMWTFGTFLLPLGLGLCIVAFMGAEWHSVVGQGELAEIAIAVLGAALALEFFMGSKGQAYKVFMMIPICLLLAVTLFYGTAVSVDEGGKLVTALTGEQIGTSKWFLGFASVCGLVTAVRHSLRIAAVDL